MNKSIERTTKADYEKGRCEICGEDTYDGSTRGTLDICTHCFWIDDEFHKNPNETCGGPNGKLSVNLAKRNYKKYGISVPHLTRNLK